MVLDETSRLRQAVRVAAHNILVQEAMTAAEKARAAREQAMALARASARRR